MSLSYIPNQPVYFSEYGSETSECCGRDFIQLANQRDNFSVQLDIGKCSDTELLTNPNFTDGSDGLDGWTDVSATGPFTPDFPPFVQEDSTLVLYPGAAIAQGGFTDGNYYLVRVNVLNDNALVYVNGGLGGTQVVFSGAGLHEGIVLMGGGGNLNVGVTSIYNQGAVVSYVQAYLSTGASDYTTEVFTVGDNPSTATPVHTVTGQALTVESSVLALNFIWDSFDIDDGCYFISIKYDCGDGDVYLVSNGFNIKENHACTKQIFACLGQDAFGFDNSRFFPSLRMECLFEKNRYPNTRNTYRDTAGKTTVYHADIEKVKELTTDYLPEYLQDWMGTLPAYANIEIDGQSWTIDEDIVDPEPLPDQPSLASIDLELKRNNTPLIKALCYETITCTPPPPNCIIWNDGEDIDWNDGECIEWNN